MSLMRLPIRPALSARATCIRCFSSGAKKQEDVLDILANSTAARHPANAPAASQPRANESAASRFVRSVGLDRASSTPSRELAESERLAQYQRQVFRRWQPGDVYAPHDLSGTEQKKWKQGRKKPQEDAFDVLGVNPVMEYKNFTIMSEYMTEMGRIKHSKDTGLRPKNQRKIAKAIRRAVGLGLMPSVHRHPLVLKKSSPARFL
ncbi:hypothetical protein ACJQWK_06985 [Exserohilum turcicum]|uniref:Small ribosomal subunit protein bS18m n=1 Tax=Exserohilum turcicum (strain 28A) TaxID=671987 RepID=R0IJ32_EXST2|nr:uncharacterized protein SETTUDRAFT_117390 [Exserohilum turcica Et28A]EOA84956.1 hypothetical protein SETTUDRAFT_117390 [Exserohilum turcica Et28A]